MLALSFILAFCLSASYAETNESSLKLINGLSEPYPAPAIKGITAWFNSPPLTLSALKGKVVFIEFWTTTCPYCVDTLSHLNTWYQRYHDKGLVIIGIHSPKQEFESNLDYLKAALAKHKLEFPVAVDNQFASWENYGVNAWPEQYLIDKQGRLVYVHHGAQDYEEMENNIRYLLAI